MMRIPSPESQWQRQTMKPVRVSLNQNQTEMESSVKKVCDTTSTRITPGLTKCSPSFWHLLLRVNTTLNSTHVRSRFILRCEKHSKLRERCTKKGGGEIEVSISPSGTSQRWERGTEAKTQTKSHTEQDHDLFCTCMLTSICGVVSIPYSYSVLIITHLSVPLTERAIGLLMYRHTNTSPEHRIANHLNAPCVWITQGAFASWPNSRVLLPLLIDDCIILSQMGLMCRDICKQPSENL